MLKPLFLLAIYFAGYSITDHNSYLRKLERQRVRAEVVKRVKQIDRGQLKVSGYVVVRHGCDYNLCYTGINDYCGGDTSVINFQYACGCAECNFEVIIDPEHYTTTFKSPHYASEPVQVDIDRPCRQIPNFTPFQNTQKNDII